MSSGIFPQPRSTVPRNCPADFVLNRVLGPVSKPEPRGIGGWIFPPSSTLLWAQAWLLPALVLISDHSLVQEKAQLFAAQIIRFVHSLLASQFVLGRTHQGSLDLPAPQGCRQCLTHTAKHLGVLVMPELVIRCVIINYWQSTQRWDCDSSVLCFFYKKNNSFKS